MSVPNRYITTLRTLVPTKIPGGGNALAFKQPTSPYDIKSGPGGLTREVETPLPSNSPHDPMILRVDLGGLTREVRSRLQLTRVTRLLARLDPDHRNKSTFAWCGAGETHRRCVPAAGGRRRGGRRAAPHHRAAAHPAGARENQAADGTPHITTVARWPVAAPSHAHLVVLAPEADTPLRVGWGQCDTWNLKSSTVCTVLTQTDIGTP
jgi:hypothetical protein